MRAFVLIIFSGLFFCFEIKAQLTPFETGDKNVSANYEQIIKWYQHLDKKSTALMPLEKIKVCWILLLVDHQQYKKQNRTRKKKK